MKSDIIQACMSRIEQMVATAQSSLDQAKEASLEETKSSAGDKFETGRAMMHAEMHKAKRQLAEAKLLQMDMKSIQYKSSYSKVEKGTLVETSDGQFFISVGLGKVRITDGDVYVISPASPLAKIMIGKSVGDQVHMNTKQIQINAIL